MVVNINGETSESKQLEIQIKLIYAKLCGKGRRTRDSDIERSYSNSDSDSEDGDIKLFGLLACEIDIDTVPRVEVVYMYGPVVR